MFADRVTVTRNALNLMPAGLFRVERDGWLPYAMTVTIIVCRCLSFTKSVPGIFADPRQTSDEVVCKGIKQEGARGRIVAG